MDKNILKRLRESRGLTQEAVADMLNVAVQTVQNWERTAHFKRSEDLHILLDIYQTDDDVRDQIVLNIYGNKDIDELDVCGKIKSHEVLSEAVGIFCSEADNDKYLYYPIEKISILLKVIEARIKSLETAIIYLDQEVLQNAIPSVYGMDAAIIIDTIGAEYDIKLGAMRSYLLGEAEIKAELIFPFAQMGIQQEIQQIDEFEKEMDYGTYYAALQKKIEGESGPSSEAVVAALKRIKSEHRKLQNVKYRILKELSQCGFWEGLIDTVGVVNTHAHVFFEVITIKQTGQSFLLPSTEKRMRYYLFGNGRDKISIDRRICEHYGKKTTISCDVPVYYCRDVVEKVVSLLEHVMKLNLTNAKAPVDLDEWVLFCQKNRYLKAFIGMIRDEEQETTARETPKKKKMVKKNSTAASINSH